LCEQLADERRLISIVFALTQRNVSLQSDSSACMAASAV
jgi:hypothetical protein